MQWKLPRPDEHALSVSLGFEGAIAAVGSSSARVHFFDIRSGSGLLGTYHQAHTDEVTQVNFQQLSSFGTTTTTTPILVSAGEDGLANVFDTRNPTEEAALQNVLTAQSSIRQVGFFGPQSNAIYTLTGCESLKLWQIDSSNCQKDYGPDLREHLSLLTRQHAAENTVGTPSASDDSNCVDYLVNCHWDTTRQELLLLGGSSSGDTQLFKVDDQGMTLQNTLRGGHRGILRDWAFLSPTVFVTAGEDARICEWNLVSQQRNSKVGSSSTSTTTTATSNGHSPMRSSLSPSGRHMPAATRGSGNKIGGGKNRRGRKRISACPY